MAPRRKPKLDQNEAALWSENEAIAFGQAEAKAKKEMLDLEDFPSSTLYYAYEAGFTGKIQTAAVAGGVSPEVMAQLKDIAGSASAAAASAAESAKSVKELVAKVGPK
jgi:hypothetical protein